MDLARAYDSEVCASVKGLLILGGGAADLPIGKLNASAVG